MVHVSMLGYGVTGAFLSLAYFDLPYNVMAITAAAMFIVNRHVQAAAAGLPTAPAPRSPAPPSALRPGRPAAPPGRGLRKQAP
jgi:hypothetical protein